MINRMQIDMEPLLAAHLQGISSYISWQVVSLCRHVRRQLQQQANKGQQQQLSKCVSASTTKWFITI